VCSSEARASISMTPPSGPTGNHMSTSTPARAQAQNHSLGHSNGHTAESNIEDAKPNISISSTNPFVPTPPTDPISTTPEAGPGSAAAVPVSMQAAAPEENQIRSVSPPITPVWAHLTRWVNGWNRWPGDVERLMKDAEWRAGWERVVAGM
jgi:hypothetical protein